MRQSSRPPVDPNLAGLFASRGKLDAHRYLETKDTQDLEEAISNMRTAVFLAKDTQSIVLGPSLGSLAALLHEQYKSTGKDAGLNEARQLAKWALEGLSDGDTDHAIVLTTLGNILTSQYERFCKLKDLEEAIFSLKVGIQARGAPGDSAFPAVALNNLAYALVKRYEMTGRREDLNDAISNALGAAEAGLSSHPSLTAGISLLLKQYKSTEKLDILANALFELRIVVEIAPAYSKLNTLLDHLDCLAMEQQISLAWS